MLLRFRVSRARVRVVKVDLINLLKNRLGQREVRRGNIGLQLPIVVAPIMTDVMKGLDKA